ncbi:tRNA (guanosine(18)-2'-O)-methyltransferase TrmH [Oleiphilus sp. HI0125]|uniref:tRNA (guanosine(18)-2'-O)-methyltransferase TrmH n=1 Tax=Oleiphilus sp. HI0125 TaxID=1822266 RepID=UPI0007C3F0D0|nr:tRNA (guanosine(18)-2'-O)-methyltransferase TrmH [Oleiphilus sp. HI0125]KZZ59207.1 tRNA (guanosine(18)-2'-O)-methyltransferase TrmH [Oleiphilus sp. HI0125]
MTPERYRRLRETLDRRQPDLTILAEQIHKPRNIAALVRTGDAVGMHELHMVWPWDKHRPYSGTAMGSDRWVNIVRHESMDAGIELLQTRGQKVYAAHLSDTALDFRDVDYTEPCAILMGNEKKGVSDEAAQKVDGHIIIPMMGMVESFNVSVAAAIILSEAQRQREKKGMYHQTRLDDHEYWQTYFRWAHPRIAEYCHQNDLDYPAINEEDGEIVDPSGWYARVRATS